jgi:hypothetical protein
MMHEEARGREHAFMVRYIYLKSLFIYGDHCFSEEGTHVERTDSYLVADLLGGFDL